jgi:potassium-dependent mechanosensitive channel
METAPVALREVLNRIAWTVCASLPVPIVLLFAMFQLRPMGSGQDLAWPLYQAMLAAVPAITVALVLARTFARHGLAEECFRWPAEICAALSRNAWVLVTTVCPLLGGAVFFRLWQDGQYSESLGRLALMLAMFALGETLWTTGSMIVRWEAARPRGSRTFWFAGGKLFRLLAVGVPMLLVFLAAIGYRHAAEQLGSRMVWTLLIGAGVMLLAGLVGQLVELQRQRLAARIEPDGEQVRQLQADLQNNFGQVLRLVQVATLTGLIVLVSQVWGDVVPLGGLLDRFQLWSMHAPGDLANAAVPWVTARHLIKALIVLGVMLAASRNLPGLIQLLLPGGLPLDKGGRYAITFVARYLVVLVGLIETASILGFAWDRVQWLVAGLTVGLGFGLQEVFANLVSGIIILLERPVRVGDVVSVNNVSGTVTRMALRATTIQDADRREWIIPNKKFITDDVMNWTLSDTVSRAVFPVSVTHGSNPVEVQELLLELAHQNSLVLDYPEPSVVLAKIGGASLDFELRVFLRSREFFTQLQNELLVGIERTFRASGIRLELSAKDPPKVSEVPKPADTRKPQIPSWRRRNDRVDDTAKAADQTVSVPVPPDWPESFEIPAMEQAGKRPPPERAVTQDPETGSLPDVMFVSRRAA